MSLPPLGRNPTNAVLLAYTFTPFANRDQWIQVAKESIDTPRFLLDPKRGLIFGSHRTGFRKFSAQEMINRINSFSSYELMTLREISPAVYNVIAPSLPTTLYLVNPKTKEFIRLGDDLDFNQMARKYPPWKESQVNEVERPVKFMKRGYRDISEDVIPPTVMFMGDEDEEEEPEEEQYLQERIEAERRLRAEIKERVESKYPNIKQVLKTIHRSFGKKGLYLNLHEVSSVEIGSLPDAVHTDNNKVNFYWPRELLPNPADPTTPDQIAFFEIIADISDYIKYYQEENQITKTITVTPLPLIPNTKGMLPFNLSQRIYREYLITVLNL